MEPSSPDLEFLTDRQLYERVILKEIPRAEKFVWLATSDLKDLYVTQNRKRVPFLKELADLAAREVSIRLIHAGEPGPAFRKDFDRYPALIGGLEQIRCPRTHIKSVIVDGTFAYTGSANLTGAGIGARSADKRNFEAGIVTNSPNLIDQIMAQFDRIWMGDHCRTCRLKKHCAAYTDLIP